MNHLKDITGTLGSELSGKRIAHCVTASVSITEAPRISRLLMRHGAEVLPLLTPKASAFVSPMLFEWATGNPPITKLTGKVEHVELVSSNKVDLILIAPCTANTLAKVASGISDDPVSTLACTALGAGIPILIAAAMHEPMHHNPIIQQAKEKLQHAGVQFVEGEFLESKAKLATPETILREVVAMMGKSTTSRGGSQEELSAYGWLISAGPTREAIDSVRFISNASSGKMGVALAETALLRGAKRVCLVHGPGVIIPDQLKENKRLSLEAVTTTKEMLESILSEISTGKYHVLISAAAPADYAPASPASGKLSTAGRSSLQLRLEATQKIIATAKAKFPELFVVAFKAERDLEAAALIDRARESLKNSGADLVVANDVGRRDIGFGSDFNEVYIVDRVGSKKATHLPRAAKQQIASGILDAVVERLGKKKL